MQYINYRESRRRGTPDFPAEYHHVTPNHPQYNMTLHWHVEFEILHVIRGALTITIDEQLVNASEGSIIIIPPGALHSAVPSDCDYECIVFDMNMLLNKNDECNALFHKIMENNIALQNLFDSNHPQILALGENMFKHLSSKCTGFQTLVFGSLYMIFGIIYSEGYFSKQSGSSKHTHRRISQLKTALEYIESHYSTNISLAEIAGSVDMSPKYFCRFFQEMTHQTPISYLNNYRIERACYQILTTDASITEIAYNCGFNDLSYFIKTFKQYKGTTPKKYLKM